MRHLFTITLLFTCAGSFAQNFTRVTSGPVVNTPGDSRSVNWVDVNSDGLIDLFISNGKAGGQNNMLYINNGGGNFTQITSDPIVLDNKPSDGASFADVDNDGDLDAHVANWYNFNNLFYTNDGNGNFTEQVAVPIVSSGGYSETASWGDYNNDGLVDLYVARSGATTATRKNLLFHNDGNATFTKILSGSPATDAFISRCVNWTDMDNDGDLDIFVANEGSTNNNENIYRNDGSGNFTSITTGPIVNNGAFTMSSSWSDYDNDGDMDVFIANDQASNALFRNDSNFNFSLVNDTVSHTNHHSFSSAWSDVDNDGDIDLFVTNSYYTSTKQLNFFYLNNGDGTFTKTNSTPLATDSSWSYGCAFGDYDNDGFEDLAVATVEFNGIDESDFLYHNTGNNNNWITINLVGTQTNRSAIGTKIRIKAVINGVAVWQMREISAQSSYCGQNDMRAHFGLGNSNAIDSIKIEWLSGADEFYTNVSSNQFISITEGQGITGVNTIKSNEDFSISPNPTTGKIIIDRKENSPKENYEILITDSKGTTIFSAKMSKHELKKEIDLQNIRTGLDGLLYISMKSDSAVVVKKVIKL